MVRSGQPIPAWQIQVPVLRYKLLSKFSTVKCEFLTAVMVFFSIVYIPCADIYSELSYLDGETNVCTTNATCIHRKLLASYLVDL